MLMHGFNNRVDIIAKMITMCMAVENILIKIKQPKIEKMQKPNKRSMIKQ